MAKYRIIWTEFWRDLTVAEEMTPEEKYFFLYLLTNPYTTQIGIYKISKREMAFDLGYSIETVESLMYRMEQYHQIIRYNPKTRELAIKNWGKYNLHRGGKPVLDCVHAELKRVQDTSLIDYVAEIISRKDILAIFESFTDTEEPFDESCDDTDEYSDNDSCDDTDDDTFNDSLTDGTTQRGQNENENENKKENHQDLKKDSRKLQDEAVQEIITFWDKNGFGVTNMNAKEQLLCWLDDSSFNNPKEVILKALQRACLYNKRKLSYVVAILRNWENDSLLTVEEIDLHEETNQKKSTEKERAGRAIPSGFELDLTEGEDQ